MNKSFLLGLSLFLVTGVSHGAGAVIQQAVFKKAICVFADYGFNDGVALIHSNGRKCGETLVNVTHSPFPSIRQDVVALIPPQLSEGEYIDLPLNALEFLRVTRPYADQFSARYLPTRPYQGENIQFKNQGSIGEFLSDLIVPRAQAQGAPASCNPRLVREKERLKLLEGFGLFMGGLSIGLAFVCPPAAGATGILDLAAGAAYLECMINMPARICKLASDEAPYSPPPPAKVLLLSADVVDSIAENPLLVQVEIGGMMVEVRRN